MKAVNFELDKVLHETGYYCTCCKHTEIDHSGTYVLASEANEQDDWNVKKRKELELEQIKANERIKALEDALKNIKHRHVPMTSRDEYRRGYTDALAIVQIIAKEALEVK